MQEQRFIGEIEKGWTLATLQDVAGSFRGQHNGAFEIELHRGVSGSAPATRDGKLTVRPGQTAMGSLDEFWPGATGSRVWIWSDLAQGGVSISHA